MKEEEDKKENKKVGRIYPNGSLVKSFSISVENWEYLKKYKKYTYSFDLNSIIDKVRLEAESKEAESKE
jgi:hypothetical protein